MELFLRVIALKCIYRNLEVQLINPSGTNDAWDGNLSDYWFRMLYHIGPLYIHQHCAAIGSQIGVINI